MQVKFWGSRGSLPASHSGKQANRKVRQLLKRTVEADLNDQEQNDAFIKELPFFLKSS